MGFYITLLDIKLRRHAEYTANLPLTSRLLSFLHGMNFLYRHVVVMVALLILLQLLVWGGTHDVLRVEMISPVALLGSALALEAAVPFLTRLPVRSEPYTT